MCIARAVELTLPTDKPGVLDNMLTAAKQSQADPARPEKWDKQGNTKDKDSLSALREKAPSAKENNAC